MESNHRPIAVLALPRTISGKTQRAREIVERMTGNPRFQNPNPRLADVTTAAGDLDTAETAVKSRTKGMAKVRDVKKAILIMILGHLRDYVQGVAESNPAEAESIIESAGMKVRKFVPHVRAELDARQGRVSGQVVLIARRVPRAMSYEWQYSADGKVWNDLPPTAQAKTSVGGLTPGTTYSFRLRVLTRKGLGDWSQDVSFMVK